MLSDDKDCKDFVTEHLFISNLRRFSVLWFTTEHKLLKFLDIAFYFYYFLDILYFEILSKAKKDYQMCIISYGITFDW